MSIIQHIALNCRDMKKQVKFYSKHFGFKLARVFNAGKPDEFIMLRSGQTCLELFQADRKAAKARGWEQPVGFKHLAFEVGNVKRSVARLRKDGIQTDDIIDCSKLVPGLYVCFFNDPDGNRLELMQGWRDEKK